LTRGNAGFYGALGRAVPADATLRGSRSGPARDTLT